MWIGSLARNVALVTVALCSAANAANITYDVNQPIGAGGVTGDIVTNGTIGSLNPVNDIVGWNLSLNSASVFGSFVLFNNGISANSTFQNQAEGIGGFFSATATKLLFDFSNGAGSYFQGINVANPLQPQFVWCLQALPNVCGAGAPGEWLSVEDLANPPPPQFVAMSGLQVIGTAASPSIPEPSTLALLGAGIALLGFFVLLRRGSRQINIWEAAARRRFRFCRRKVEMSSAAQS